MKKICMKDSYNGINPCLSLSDFIKQATEKYESLVAFKTYNMQWTYGELYHSIRQCYPYFLDGEVKYYCLDIDDPFHFCVLFFAVILAGKVAVLGKKEQFSLNDSIEEIGINDYQKIKSTSHPFDSFAFVNEDEMSVIALSSGTTSVSKGVMLSQHNILSDTFSGAIAYGYPQGAVYLNILPYTHLFGIVADMLGPLASGGTICFSNNKLNIFKDMQAFSPTHMNLPPAVIYTIEKALLQSQNILRTTGGLLRKIMCAGAKIEENTVREMLKYDIEVLAAYGLTECSPCVSMNTSDGSKIGSVGRILPCCKARIKDSEIVVSGENIMLGYFGDIESTQNVMHDGWLYTGDLGYIDDDGYLYITGRKANVIVLENGKKIATDILESELCKIHDVEEALITSDTRNNRVLLNIRIVSRVEQKLIIDEIDKFVKKYGINDRIKNITVTLEPLKKNKLGKVIRSRY